MAKKERSKKHILAAVIMPAIILGSMLWVINEFTNVFTDINLSHEERLVIKKDDPRRTEKMLQELIRDSKSKLMLRRKEAAVEMGNIGKKAAIAIPELERLVKDKNFEVRKAAEDALKKIRGDS